MPTMEIEKLLGAGIRAAVYFDEDGYVYSALPQGKINLDVVDTMTALARKECAVRNCARCEERSDCMIAVFPFRDGFLGVMCDSATDLSGVEDRVKRISTERLLFRAP